MSNNKEALEKNETWTLCDLPHGKMAIRCAWKFKLKLNPNGNIDKPKSRLVAQGFTQVKWDFHECFSPVAKWATIRTMFNFAFVIGWHL